MRCQSLGLCGKRIRFYERFETILLMSFVKIRTTQSRQVQLLALFFRKKMKNAEIQNQSSNHYASSSQSTDSILLNALQEMKLDIANKLKEQNDKINDITNQVAKVSGDVKPNNNTKNTILSVQALVQKSEIVPNWMDRFIVEVSQLLLTVFSVHSY